MSNFEIITDSTCDLPMNLIEQYRIHITHLTVILDGNSYPNYLDERELKYHDFYEGMRNKKLPTTSATNTAEFLSVMEPILLEGKDILYIGFSSGMSCSYNVGCQVSMDLMEKFPDRTIYCIDSLSACLGQGMLAIEAAKGRDAGKTLETVRDEIEDLKLHICHSFTIDDLLHIMRGGRSPKCAALLGSVLNIKPILRVDNEGHLIPISKARGRKKAFKEMVSVIQTNIIDPTEPIYIGHGDCLEEAEYVAELLRSELGATDITISYVGAVCGSHAGPSVLAIFYRGISREENAADIALEDLSA